MRIHHRALHNLDVLGEQITHARRANAQTHTTHHPNGDVILWQTMRFVARFIGPHLQRPPNFLLDHSSPTGTGQLGSQTRGTFLASSVTVTAGVMPSIIALTLIGGTKASGSSSRT